jgi:transketolase
MSIEPLQTPLDERSRKLRKQMVRMMEEAGRGHLASAFSLVEMLRVLYDDVLNYDPRQPDDPNRDRLILSKGHGCMALYVMLAEKGFFAEQELWDFCKTGGLLGGHPEHKVPGVEASTGSLGHGLSFGVGFALNAKMESADYRTYVIVGDGECNEGAIWEAALAASKHQLKQLTVLVDYNKLQSYGPTAEIQELEPFADKWRAFGFEASEIDGHDLEQLRQALQQPVADKPRAIICHTVKGKGIPEVENNLSWHHKSKLPEEKLADLYAALEVD